jgi:MFS superfamily sulfate permease-like transporter
VIKGMLAAIGLILILKQLPHFVGYDADPEGDFYFFQPDHENTFTGLLSALRYFEPGAVLVGFISALVLWLYNLKALKTGPFSKLLPGPLVVVVAGVLINKGLAAWYPALLIGGDHLVQLPVSANPASFFAGLPKPQFQGLLNPQVWITALTLAIVASLETLLSIEAVDKLDPQKRISPTNRELKAQGMGNLVSGLLGGLPVTSVIVRSSANVQAGAQSKLSAIMHGVWLLLSVLFFPQVLSMIPKASLAAILIFTGYKLANITLLKEYFRKGSDQSIPFFVTIGAILISDLLTGIIVGIIAGLFFVLRSNFRTSVFVVKDELRYLVRFRKEVSFLNKAYVKKIFEQMPDNVAVLIDATKSEFIDKDIVELVNDFIVNAETRGIRVYIKYGPGHSQNYFNDISKRVIQ